MRKLAFLFVALAVLGLTPVAQAGIIVNYTPGTLYTTAGIYDFSTYSSDMNGMAVTATWLQGTTSYSQTKTWNSGVAFTGLPSGSDFDLIVSGDTFTDDAWQLDFKIGNTTAKLQSLTFDGAADKTVFDLTWGGATGTAGSSLGKTFQAFEVYVPDCGRHCGDYWATYSGNITATYSNLVKLNASASAVGDLYTQVGLAFSGGLAEGDYRFTMDADNATSSIVPHVDPVPEPASMMLLATGLFGLAGAVRRRRAAK